MRKLHLKQSGFTYSACGPFTQDRKGIQKLKKVGNSKHLYKNVMMIIIR